MKKASIIIYTSIAVVGIGAGSYLGYFLSKRNDSSGLTPNTNDVVRDDDEKIYANINSSYNDLAKTDFSNTSDYSISDVVNYAIYNTLNSDKVTVIGIGDTETNAVITVNQGITSSFIKENDKYFKESISLSNMANVANRTYLVSNDEIKVYGGQGSAVDLYTATYEDNNFATYTNETYLEKFGVNYDTFNNYIISNDSVKKQESKVGDKTYKTSITKTSDGYDVVLNLDPSKSTVDYRVMMLTQTDMTIGDDGKPIKPIFHGVGMTIKLTNDLLISQIDTYEHYHVAKFGYNEMFGSLTEKFFYDDSSLAIPELNATIPYESLFGVK